MATRTCAGCRDEADRDDLVRLVALPDGTVGIDLKGSLPGRGAWVHPRAKCVLASPKAVGRTLKAQASGDVLLEQLRRATERAVADGVSLAAAAGALVGGFEALCRALRAGDVVEVAVSNDASERTVKGLREAAGAEIVFTTIPVGSSDLGGRVGRGARAALGVRSSRATNHLRRQLRRLRDLG